MARRRWDSQNIDTIYGDAAARVLCRMLGAAPSGRSLRECLNRVPVPRDPKEALANGLNGDGSLTLSNGTLVGVECKASLNGTANVCWDPWEFQHSTAAVLAAWVPATHELCWFVTADEARKAAIWLEKHDTWLICRDRLES